MKVEVIPATETTELLGEVVYIKLLNGEFAEGFCVKEFPNIKVKLLETEELITKQRGEVYIEKPYYNPRGK